MGQTVSMAVAAVLAVVAPSGIVAPDRELTFDDRVALEERVQRAYYTHRVGTDESFEEAVSRDLLEHRVRDVLDRRALLREVWGREISSDALRRETLRVVDQTRMPGRLDELFKALDDDPVLIQEALVLPALVRRLSLRLLDGDPRFRTKSWEEIALHYLPAFDLDEVPIVADESLEIAKLRTRLADSFRGLEAVRGACVPGADDVWAAGGSLDDMLQTDAATAVWTGTEVIIWGGYVDQYERTSNTGGRYDPVLDNWTELSTVGAPEARYDHTAVWTGTEMIVWGGRPRYWQSGVATGGRYDPVTDSWTATTTVGASVGRARHDAIWTGTEMIVWGGATPWNVPDNTGSRYDPVTDSWSAVSDVSAPGPRNDHTTVWTGTEVIIWGGKNTSSLFAPGLNTGGIYDPATDTWTATAAAAAPSMRHGHTAVWTGTEMIVWGGWSDLTTFANGGRYNPATDQWAGMNSTGTVARRWHIAVWTGTEMIVVGHSASYGERYDPVADTWQDTTAVGAPPSGAARSGNVWTGSEWIVWARGIHRYDPAQDVWLKVDGPNGLVGRIDHSAVWTGNDMIVWGGRWSDTIPNSEGLDDGARYDPVLDTWTPMSSMGAPAGRFGHIAVWTGSEKIVFGGIGGAASGGRYDPLTDQWTPVSTIGAPVEARYDHTAVWTGTEMIVWGGNEGPTSFDTGARYDPASNSWQMMSTVDAPVGRNEHTAVWTGSEMIVWGGDSFSSSPFDSGGRYDPVSDSWSATNQFRAPTGRRVHTAVWTGTEMIVWGGTVSGPSLSSGARYEPVTDAWTPTQTTGAPTAREAHGAVWTGAEMIVWGGEEASTGTSTGGRYRPVTDTWLPTSLSDDRPGNRWEHTTVWTGESMIVWGGRRGGMSLTPGLHTGGVYYPTGQVFDEPGAITGLRWLSNETTLEWDSAAATAGPGVEYDVLRGEVSELPVGAGMNEVCLEPLTPDTSTDDASLPGAGTTYYYLVRGSNVCATGTYGSESSGAPRVSGICP